MSRLHAGFGAVFLVVAVTAGLLWRELETERERNASLLQRITAIEGVSGTPAVLPGMPAGTQTVSAAPGGAGNAADVPGSTGELTEETIQSMFAGIQQTLNTPEGREFATTMVRMGLDGQYPDLAKELGITQQEADKLLDLLAKHAADVSMQRMTLQSGARDQSAREARATQLAEQEQANEAEISALLGGNYQKWKDYEGTSVQRQQANMQRQRSEQLRSAISSPRSPVTDTQLQALQTALDAEQRRLDQEARGLTVPQRLERLAEEQRQLAEIAATHLDAEQLERYRRYQQQQAATARLVMGAMEGATRGQGQQPAPRP